MVESIGMKVNAEKTTMVCFSDSVGYTTDAYIEEADAVRIHCQDSMNVLGMRFSFWPDMSAHVAWIVKNLRERLWIPIFFKEVVYVVTN